MLTHFSFKSYSVNLIYTCTFFPHVSKWVQIWVKKETDFKSKREKEYDHYFISSNLDKISSVVLSLDSVTIFWGNWNLAFNMDSQGSSRRSSACSNAYQFENLDTCGLEEEQVKHLYPFIDFKLKLLLIRTLGSNFEENVWPIWFWSIWSDISGNRQYDTQNDGYACVYQSSRCKLYFLSEYN